ncbi:hypothetical protein BDB00DRAFT_784952 [Zychaea mexicana]|uniref:uncharacterized protein n=1 Tax=Zychaea mexicana TaxID=64656 RepID=UPI0022FE5A87|nr:uncharacterized protein BDB00DRAFT_784952 [Zychaea mexicana]KAI9497226.1 hypothetical protein BDB00DRAFT_784952 [Zychaea mexicana]
MDNSANRKKRKLPKRGALELREYSPDIDVPIPGSETFISPSALDSPSFPQSRRPGSPITVGTPTGSKRDRQYAKPLTKPSKNFAERLQHVTDLGGSAEDEFLTQHSILPKFDSDSTTTPSSSFFSSQASINDILDENTRPDANVDAKDESKYRVIPRKVNNLAFAKKLHADVQVLPEKKLVDTAVQVVVKSSFTNPCIPMSLLLPSSPPIPQLKEPLQDSPKPPPSPTTSVSSCENGLADLAEIQQQQQQQQQFKQMRQQEMQQPIPIQVSTRIQTRLSKRKIRSKSSNTLDELRAVGMLDWIIIGL